MKHKQKVFIASIILFVIFIGLFIRYYNRAPKRHYSDFRVYYATANRFIEKDDIYDRPQEAITPFKYSPFFAMLLSPLSFFTQRNASLIFFTINFIALIFIFFITGRLTFQHQLPSWKIFLLSFIVFIFSSRFIFLALDSGQVSIIMLLLISVSLYFLEQKKDIASGALLALSVMFKYTPFIFIPYLIWKRKFRAVKFFFLFIFLYCLAPVAYLGVQVYAQYMSKWIPWIIGTSTDHSSWYSNKNQSLFSFVLRYFTSDSSFKIPIFHLSFSQGFFIAAMAACGLYLLIIFTKNNKAVNSCIDYALLLLCMALFNPNAWMHNFVVFIPAFMLIFFEIMKNKFKDKINIAAVIISFFLINFTSETAVGNDLERIFENLSSVAIAALILFFVLLRIRNKKLEKTNCYEKAINSFS